MLAKFSEKHNIKINHAWHKDQGFQKTKILNKAILQSNSNYLLFTDGDCIPRKDLVKKHIELRRDNHFLSGSYYKLNEQVSETITIPIIKEQSSVPVIVDAGVGTASDATIAMELGCDGVLLNTAIAEAKYPILMAEAMKYAVISGRKAFKAKRMKKRNYGSASSPETNLI